MDFSDIFDDRDERRRKQEEERAAEGAKEQTRKQGNAEKLHAHMAVTVRPVFDAACAQLTQRGINGRLEAVQECRAAPGLSMGLRLAHWDNSGHTTAIAHIAYEGACDTLAIRFEMYGSDKFASIKANEMLTIEQCTAASVTARTREFLRAILA